MSGDKSEVLQGTLDLMVLKTLESMGPLHGYGIARRIEQVSGDGLSLNQGTIYPALLRLEQRGWINSEWGTSEADRNGDRELGADCRDHGAVPRAFQLGACDGHATHTAEPLRRAVPPAEARRRPR